MNRSCGFSLIEVVATLTILGGSCIVLVHAQSQTLDHLQAARMHTHAAELAQELHAQWLLAQRPVEPDQGTVLDAPGWHWELQASPAYTASMHELRYLTLRLIHVSSEGNGFEADYQWLEAPDGDKESSS